MPANPNDKIREQILKYFYDRDTSATSRLGKKGSAAKISDVKRELKSEIGNGKLVKNVSGWGDILRSCNPDSNVVW
jgi:hypothetical protein